MALTAEVRVLPSEIFLLWLVVFLYVWLVYDSLGLAFGIVAQLVRAVGSQVQVLAMPFFCFVTLGLDSLCLVTLG